MSRLGYCSECGDPVTVCDCCGDCEEDEAEVEASEYDCDRAEDVYFNHIQGV